jgi:16S rRNA (adenine1518-N6/adenine1519-N6)-dimethyltransferase
MAMMLPSLSDIIKRHGLSARKSLGQHFLLDANITDKIVRAGGNINGINVIEIGAGPGGLTRSLLKSAAKCVVAVEKDGRCVAALSELNTAYGERLVIIPEDALTLSPMEIAPAPRAIIANLPYNIGTPLLVKWLDEIARNSKAYDFLTLMFQKEVAMRLLAEPGGKQYGRLSVMVQWLCDIEHCFDLPASAFTPPPKVASTVIKLTPLAKPRYPADKRALESTVAAAFGNRRKMLRSSLATLHGNATDWLRQADIDPTRRAETLNIEEFCRLASRL